MADEPAGRTSLGVLHEILNNLGDSNTYLTVVDALEALLNALGSGGIGQAVSDWLTAHPEATTTVQNGSITLLKLANDVKSAINGKAASDDLQALADDLEALAQELAGKADASDLDDKADIDGYYSQLTAGLAENLIGRGDAVTAEYLYRTAGGDADIEDGIATVSCIKGNTVTWNQLVPDTGIHKSGTAASSTWLYTLNFAITSGHKYLLVRSGTYPDHGNTCRVVSTTGTTIIYSGTPNIPNKQGIIFDCTDTRDTYFVQAWVISGEDYDFYLNVFDLTLMFGSGNEPSTVEEFEAMFPLPYYPYSAPKLLPVDIRGIETVGFNLWDEEWELGVINSATGENASSSNTIRSKNYIHILPNTVYYNTFGDGSNKTNFQTRFYDADKRYIGYVQKSGSAVDKNSSFTTPENAHYMRFQVQSDYGSAYKGDICINLSWSGYRNGEYEEHWSAERPIDTSRFFPTGMKKVGDKADALYADHYDTVIGAYTFTGNESVYLEDWRHVDGYYACSIAYASIPNLALTDGFDSLRMADLDTISYEDAYRGMVGICEAPQATPQLYGIFVRVPTSIASNAAQVLAWLAGKQLYYELATPTTTEIEPPLNLSYKVSDFGTEKVMVDEEADAPQSAPPIIQTAYGINATDTVRRLPTQYISHESFQQFVAALQSAVGITVTETWDENDGRYEYTVTQTGE